MSSLSWRKVGVLAVAVVVGGACGRSGLLELEPEPEDGSGVRDLAQPGLDLSVVDLGRVDLAGRDLSSPRDLGPRDLGPRDLSLPRDLTPPPRDLVGVDLTGFDLAPPPVDLSPPPDLSLTCPGGCDDNNPCTVDACDPNTGRCVFAPAPNGTGCDDGNFCSVGDRCVAGRCLGAAPRDCSDGNSCTFDVCSQQAQACVHQNRPNGAQCDDNNRCTFGDRCFNGSCMGLPRVCNDFNVCTVDSCEPSTGVCVFTPANGALCNDNNPCTTNDACTMGRCTGTPVTDGLQCVVPRGAGCCTAGMCTIGGC